ncbi:MAG TPA: PQQ-binding-like beta-propeller repeat protein [archaeon]|nr:PQQ-binding-like beta-propeller repeat protein [archaeon]
MRLYGLVLVTAAALCSFTAGDAYAKDKRIRFFTETNARWWIDKGGFARTSSLAARIRVPLELIWNKRISRSIGATPSAAGDYIFIGTRDRRLFILERNSGQQMARRGFKGGFGGSVLIKGEQMFFNTQAPDGKVYSTEINSKHKHIQRQIGPANASPILEQNQLFLFTQLGKVLSLNPDVGYRNWQQELKGKIEYAPVFLDPYLYIPTLEGTIYKLDSVTGEVIAKNNLHGHLLSDLCSDGFYIFGALTNGKVFCLEPDSLKTKWEVQLENQFFSSPVYSEGSLFLCARAGWLVKLTAENGNFLWKTKLNGITVSAPSLTKELAFTGTKSGEMAAFYTESGERCWYRNINEGISASPLIYKDFLYYCTDNGSVYAFHPK